MSSEQRFEGGGNASKPRIEGMFQAKKQHGQFRAYQVHPRGSRSHWPEP